MTSHNNHPHLIELLSKLLRFKLKTKEIDNNHSEYFLDPESVKSAYPMMVYNIDGEDVVNYQQITIYLLGCMQELYNQLYDTQNEVESLKEEIKKLKSIDSATPSD